MQTTSLPPPIQSYRIWKTQRSGSTLLYKALTDTDIAGIPGEHFYLSFQDTYQPESKLTPFEHFQQALWQLGMTSNRVCGINHDFSHKHYAPYFQALVSMRGMPADQADGETFWAEIFPNCQHIFLTRRNKIRQAVSWWRAIQDEVSHLTNEESHTNPDTFYEEKYNLDALKALLQELMLKECNTQAYFQANDIVPLTICYEDLVADYEGTVRDVLTYLGLYQPSMHIPAMHYRQTADHKSEIWVDRLRADLQGEDHANWVW